MEISIKKLVSQTLSFSQLINLGLSVDEIAKLLLVGAKGKRITTKDLHNDYTGLYIQRTKLMALVLPEVKDDVDALVNNNSKVHITGKLLEVARLNLTDLVPYVANIEEATECLQLEKDEILLLEASLQRKSLDKKCTLAFATVDDQRAGIRAEFCPLLPRCKRITEKEVKTSARYLCCAECYFYWLEREQLKSRSQVKAPESFGVVPYSMPWPSTGSRVKKGGT